jgi:hypothetical protein
MESSTHDGYNRAFYFRLESEVTLGQRCGELALFAVIYP